MRLLVGLGNPGDKYARNRHNIGFLAVDEIVRRHSFGAWRSRFSGHVAEGMVAGEKVLALKPQTYMNNSGRAVGEAVRFFKLDPGDVIVIHDEIDLVPGKMRVKRGGGAAGHNGLRDIDAHIGQDYTRVRLGVGHPGTPGRVRGHVLDDFSKSDITEWLAPLLDAVAEAFPLLAVGDASRFQTKVALILNPPPPKPTRNDADRGAPASGAGPDPRKTEP